MEVGQQIFRRFDVPLFASLNPSALVLSLAAAFAVFRLKLGTIPTLLASSVAGIALYLTIGAG